MNDTVLRFCLENKLVVALIVIAMVAWGAMVAPFDWDLGGLPLIFLILYFQFRSVITTSLVFSGIAIAWAGGMLIEITTMLVVPVLYCSVQEWKLRFGIEDPRFAEHAGS